MVRELLDRVATKVTAKRLGKAADELGPRLLHLERRREMKDLPPVLDRHDAARREALAVAQAVDEVDDRNRQVAGQDEVAVHRVRGTIGLDRARGRDERLRHDLAAVDAAGAELRVKRNGREIALRFQEQFLPAANFNAPEHRVEAQPVFVGQAGVRILSWREHGEALACKVPHAVLEVVDGGHMLPVAQADLTVQFIRSAAAC